jgi:hypothetical protein
MGELFAKPVIFLLVGLAGLAIVLFRRGLVDAAAGRAPAEPPEEPKVQSTAGLAIAGVIIAVFGFAGAIFYGRLAVLWLSRR